MLDLGVKEGDREGGRKCDVSTNNRWRKLAEKSEPRKIRLKSGSGVSAKANCDLADSVRNGRDKKKAIYPRQPIFVNLKSNTMKNTVQR